MNKEDVTKQMQDIINQMNEASAVYGKDAIMTDHKWDDLYNQLTDLEEESGIILPESPTQSVGAEEEEDIPGEKVEHEFSALSLAKNKDIKKHIKWAQGRKCFVSWKEDGMTLVVTYDNGNLTRIVTRGDGYVGTDITRLKDVIKGILPKIDYKGHLVVRGECVISYPDFKRVNESLPAGVKLYDNTRNLVSGTLKLSDEEVIKDRNPQFIAFTLRYLDDESVLDAVGLRNSWETRQLFLKKLGFNIVSYKPVEHPETDLQSGIDEFTAEGEQYEMPVDGLVLCYEDWDYSLTGGVTGHHATRAGYAFKWPDEAVETKVVDIEWSDSRTGLFNPVAIFEPVRLCGTTVTRASLSNLSTVKKKDIKIGDRITVYKANMIIPCVEDNKDADVQDTDDWNFICERHNIPKICPHCGRPLTVKTSQNAELVICLNPDCSAKLIGSMAHFCERDCMNIMGVSEKKLQQLIDLGVVESISDLVDLPMRYHASGNNLIFVDEFGDDCNLANQTGWGEGSVLNLVTGIETACKNATFIKFLHAMGIPNFGRGQAKLLAPVVAKWMKRHNDMHNDITDMLSALSFMVEREYDFTTVDGFGEIIVGSLTTWAEHNLLPYEMYGVMNEIGRILQCLTFTDKPEDYIKETSGSPVDGKTFVVTGDVHIFKNRKDVEVKIEELGGKLSGSVSKKTDYLINNDIESTSSKNQKAKTLGIPIITEEQFCEMIGMQY